MTFKRKGMGPLGLGLSIWSTVSISEALLRSVSVNKTLNTLTVTATATAPAGGALIPLLVI